MFKENYGEQFLKRAKAIVNFVNSKKEVCFENGCVNFLIESASINENGELVISYKDNNNQLNHCVYDDEEYRINYILRIDRKYKTICLVNRPSWLDIEEFSKNVR